MPPHSPHRGPPQGGGRPHKAPGQPARGSGGSLKDTLASSLALKDGYVGPDNRLRPALLDQEAQDAARRLASITTTQLRRFYGQVLAIKRRLDVDTGGEVTDSEVLAQVAFLKASAAYTAGRDTKNKAILDFLMPHANTIRGRDDFRHFHRHFETVIAFHKVYVEDGKSRQ